MDSLMQLVSVLIPVLYALAAERCACQFRHNEAWERPLGNPFLPLAVVVHAGFIVARIVIFERVPLAGLAEALSIIVLLAVTVQLLAEGRQGNPATRLFLLTGAVPAQVLAAAFMPVKPVPIPEVLKGPLFGVHATAAVLGCCALALSAVYGILYLVLYRDLKVGRFGRFYERLPSLERLATINLRTAVVGFLALTAAIGLGMRWFRQGELDYTFWDPKVIGTLTTWTFYALALGMHYLVRIRPRRMARLTIFGLALLILSIVTARFAFESFHGF